MSLDPEKLKAQREALRRNARQECAEALVRLPNSAALTPVSNAPVSVLLYELQRIERMSPEQLEQSTRNRADRAA